MKKAVLAAALAAALASPLAMANDKGVYVGASVGSSKYDGLPNVDSATGGKLLLGYSFNSNIAVEAGYLTFGSAGFRSGIVSGTIEVDGFNASLVMRAPMNDQLSLHGKVGYFDGKAKASAGNFGASDRGSDPSYGLGLTYMFNKNAGARLEWDRVGSGDAIDLVSAGVVFKF
jgi:OmpA-OmpF porin, OOP family